MGSPGKALAQGRAKYYADRWGSVGVRNEEGSELESESDRCRSQIDESTNAELKKLNPKV